MIRQILAIYILSLLGANSREITDHSSRFILEASRFTNSDYTDGTRWAVLIAGSKGWDNYRHQADVCHAYQILKKGGLNDENIVVMMYDDIAHDPSNPRPGVIINHPQGDDVYHGVPKDYTGEDVNADNFFNVVLGNKTAIKGGSGKVVDSGPNDNIFIYYVDHGSPLSISTPTGYITADELNKVLKQKYDSETYKTMVFYLEACEGGSMFDGLLSPKLNIYATTASNPNESSYGYYCPGMTPAPPSEYDTCLGDLYSIAWMEDCDNNSATTETLGEQYQRVKDRTAKLSHVMEYGDLSMSTEKLSVYISAHISKDTYADELLSEPQSSSINQRDADLLHLREKYRRAPEGSQQKLEAKKKLNEAMEHRKNVDNTIDMIGKLLFGSEKGLEVMKTRPAGQPPVDDWDCFKTLLHTYESKCGALSVYGRKHTRVFANFCNAGIRQEQMEKASAQACSTKV